MSTFVTGVSFSPVDIEKVEPVSSNSEENLTKIIELRKPTFDFVSLVTCCVGSLSSCPSAGTQGLTMD